jgi:tetratricopeptide (TPR) repeat protein
MQHQRNHHSEAVAIASHEANRESFLNTAKSLFDIGMNSTDLSQGECYLQRAYGMLTSLSEEGKATILKTSPLYPCLVQARLRLGQIAAFHGKLEEAFTMLRDIVMDEPNSNANDATLAALRAAAWYDIGIIWMSCDRPDHALQAFQQAVSVPSSDILSTHNMFARFVPHAMRHLEVLVDYLEQGRSTNPAIDSQLRWSIELILPDLQHHNNVHHSCNQCFVPGESNKSILVWAAGAA